MDVLSMQIANKVRKRMDTEYGGIYETFTATSGQTTVVTSGAFSTTGHLLKVFVDGILAIQGTDYTLQDGQTIVFTKGLTSGDIVLATTEVVGIPRFTVTNPAYDDTELRDKVAGIVAAMDEDGDGSILDTIANIKTQWEGADGDLTTLINNKVEQAVVDAIIAELTGARGASESLQARLDAIVALIPAAYSDTEVQASITAIEETLGLAGTDITDLQTKVTNILAVLDADTDGQILDALTDLKAQWELADGDLTTLITNKAEQSVVDAIGATLTALSGDVTDKAEEADLTALSGRVGTVETEVAAKASTQSVTDLSGRVTVLEEAPAPVFAPLVDTVTGWEYNLKVTSGSLVAELIRFLQTALLSRAGSGTILIGATEQLTASAEYQDTTVAPASFSFGVDNASIGSVDAAGLFTALAEGTVEVTVTAELDGETKTASVSLTVVAP